MKDNEIIIGFDINKKPYLIWANDSNATETTQSDAEFLISDYEMFGTWEETFQVTGNPGTQKHYIYSINGEWDYEHTEYDYKINLKEV